MSSVNSSILRVHSINSVILDLGGVVLDIDYSLTLKAFSEVGVSLTDHTTFTGSNELFNLFDCGQVTPAEFRLNFNQTFGVTLSPEQFDKAWNALLLDWDMERLALIEQLRSRYHVFLLSNTNAIHFEHYNQMLVQRTGKGLRDYFHKAYFSFEMGLRKPQPEIFKRVIDDNGLTPAQTLFVDDTLEHVRAAQSLGINAVHLEGGNRNLPLSKVLAGLLIK